MKGKDFDAIIVPGYYTEAGKIVKPSAWYGELTNQSLVVMDSTVKSLYNKQPLKKHQTSTLSQASQLL